MNLSSALVYSTQPPVSVYGTGGCGLKLRRFSRELDYRRYHRSPEALVYYRASTPAWICLRLQRLHRFNGLFRQPADVSLLRLSFRIHSR